MTKTKVCHISSVHWAYDTRIHNRMCHSLAEEYDVHLIACNNGGNETSSLGVKIWSYPTFKNRIFRVFTSWFGLLYVKNSRH